MEKELIERLLFLDNIIYLDIVDYNKYTLYDAVTDILDNIDNFVVDKTVYDEAVTNGTAGNIPYSCVEPAAMTQQEWLNLLKSFLYTENEDGELFEKQENVEFLKSYRIENYVTNDSDENGMRASCFVKRDENGAVLDTIAVFRGTYGGSEWKDDILMANAANSEIMDEALMYINNLPQEYGNNITVSGHSKGGNKAQYVTILSDQAA